MSPSAEGFVADSRALKAVKESIAQEVPYGLLGQEVKRSSGRTVLNTVLNCTLRHVNTRRNACHLLIHAMFGKDRRIH